MKAENLCDFCSTIDFAAVGFHDASLEARSFALDRKVRDILQCSATCLLCQKIAEFCHRWRSRKYGDFKSMRFEETTAEISTLPYRSSEEDDDGNPLALLVYLAASVTTKMPDPYSGYCTGTILFHKVGSTVCSVSDFVDQAIPIDGIEPYTARLRPLLADLRLFRKWKQICHDEHEDTCFKRRDDPGFTLRLIDVEDCLLLSDCRDLPFVALSYVWGKDTKPCLTRATEKHFRTKGSLDRNTVPATIWDAITVTRALGERYLWVDAVCINQDDAHDKLKYVPCMDLIYGLASVTIIAASGIDADAGLSGVRPGSRSRVQESFTAKGVHLMETLDPYGNDTSSYIKEGLWSERGWVFQERLLSCRALVFTDEQVYWECAKAFWTEDSYREVASSATIYRHCIDDDFPRYPLTGESEEFEREYRLLVEKFSKREFGYEGDYLHGFSGILRAFRDYEVSFVWGLPESFFSSALTWPTENMPSPPSADRRLALHSSVDAEGTLTKCAFPSWSWLGWNCRVYFTQQSDELQPNDNGLKFYTIDQQGQFRLIQELKAVPSEDDRDDHYEEDAINALSTPLATRVWRGKQSQPVSRNISPRLLRSPQARAALCFWTSTSIFDFHANEEIQSLRHRSFYGKRKGMDEYDFPIDANWKHMPSMLDLSDSSTENMFGAAVVGDTDTWGGRRENLNVMLLSWDGDGVGYRVGMLSMLEEDWIKLERKWEQLTLC